MIRKTQHHDPANTELSALIAAIPAALPQGCSDLQRDFVREYYTKTPLVELQKFEPSRAANLALNSFDFFATKHARVQIRSFVHEQDGLTVMEVHNDDHSFILDSMLAELNRQGFELEATIHPVFYLKRDKENRLTKIVGIQEDGSVPSGTLIESFIHFRIRGVLNEQDRSKLEHDLRQVLHAAEYVVDDFAAMDSKTDESIKELSRAEKHIDPAELSEAKDFLRWLAEKHFVFLGYMEYDYVKQDNCLKLVENSELGLFRLEDEELKPRALNWLSADVCHTGRDEEVIEITKSSRKSMVHRPVLMDYIAVKRFDSKGNVIGERRFVGMFTSTVYYQSAERIPFIRRKIQQTLVRANYDPVSHNGKALKAILEFYPRDELFQISRDELFRFSIGLMALETKPEVKLFSRSDPYQRYVSCMIYIPRERFSSYLREQIVTILESAYQGNIRDFYTQLTDSPLARVHVIIKTTPGDVPEVDVTGLEEKIALITNQWSDALRDELAGVFGAGEIEHLHSIYADAFPPAYIESQSAAHAVHDIVKINEAIERDGLAVDIFRRKNDDQYHLKIYTYKAERALSAMLPILENMGCWVKEVNPYSITPRWDKGDITIRDFWLELPETHQKNLETAKPLFEEALREVWSGRLANGQFNALVLVAGFSHREVSIFRAYTHYLRQIGFNYSNRYISGALCSHPQAVRHIRDAFIAKFDPDQEDGSIWATHLQAAEAYLDQVSNLAEDRIIRRFINLVMATLRTNYFQLDADGKAKSYLSMKFRSALIDDMPKVEGIHLRGDEVARGGLRWSDRPEDYRTEVLGLVKAQMVKNAVIVPQGAKGGFVVQNPPAGGDRAALMEEGIACYKEFLSGLLDITDNILQGEVVKPPRVVCHDGDDPYLVVAADKGTASFSDIANGVAQSYDFWLGDAFASGGSQGYDHKAMGITARGAWVSVERHFLEMGVNIAKEDFTVVGIGDMSGDVFGNGMLLSEHICLVGAFNHRHIFLDPDPDAKKSFKERKRLFESRGGWDEYNQKLISAGGGIFTRDQKRIPLSKRVREVLQTELEEASPEALISLMLKAPVDLLWNGGIGTYVKASDEAHAEVGDRANDNLRVSGNELRCKVVGEGGNLGFTQRGRIEFAQNGGRINTDAIDNSAGVDCSDHEVNIKIALQNAVKNNRLSVEARNQLLEAMTEDVARLVLVDNKLQTQALSVTQEAGSRLIEPLSRMMNELEHLDFLDRKVEFLPTGRQLSERRARGEGLTRPELAVLLSYAKLHFYQQIKDSRMVQSDYFIPELLRYFPEAMQEHYRDDILTHHLRAPIVATLITNSIVNRAGITFAYQVIEELSIHPCDVARAYVISRDAFRLRDIWKGIEELTGQVSSDLQAEMFLEVQHFLEHSVRWFIENCPEPINITQAMQDYAQGVEAFAGCFEGRLSKTLRRSFERSKTRLAGKGVPAELAARIAGLEVMASACDVVRVANRYQLPIETACSVYFEVGAALRIGWLRKCARKLQTPDYWNQLAINSLIRELYLQQRRLTAQVVQHQSAQDDCAGAISQWQEAHQKHISRYQQFVEDLKGQEHIELPMLIVALRNIESIAAQTQNLTEQGAE
jgi:glutamate dehydrogenase